MLVQRVAISDDVDVAEAQPERRIETLHERHRLERHAAADERPPPACAHGPPVHHHPLRCAHGHHTITTPR